MMNPKLSTYIKRHEFVLKDMISHSDIPAKRIREAMSYTLFPGGKRLRPILVYLCGEILQTNPACLDIIAAAIELTHCYSLIHDDLPAMDNDDFRRGKPSCHKAFDEATAILVGDGMQALAIDWLLSRLPEYLAAEKVVAITQELVQASGPTGMVSGQSLDLSELIKDSICEDSLSQIHLLKTGKLFSACINMVIYASENQPVIAQALKTFANHLGLVFQMQDDYLDRYGSLGKGRASDLANQKLTFAHLYDQERLLAKINEYYQLSQQALSPLGDRAAQLGSLIEDLQARSMSEPTKEYL